MKKSIILIVALVFTAFSVPAMAQGTLPLHVNKAVVEDNLLVGLASTNTGLQRSCALMLGQIHSDRNIIPLMAVLRTHPDQDVRVAAAWALCKIGDARGVYAVRMSAKFDENSKVQTTCAWYYENIVKQGTFTFTQPEPPMVATTE